MTSPSSIIDAMTRELEPNRLVPVSGDVAKPVQTTRYEKEKAAYDAYVQQRNELNEAVKNKGAELKAHIASLKVEDDDDEQVKAMQKLHSELAALKAQQKQLVPVPEPVLETEEERMAKKKPTKRARTESIAHIHGLSEAIEEYKRARIEASKLLESYKAADDKCQSILEKLEKAYEDWNKNEFMKGDISVIEEEV